MFVMQHLTLIDEDQVLAKLPIVRTDCDIPLESMMPSSSILDL